LEPWFLVEFSGDSIPGDLGRVWESSNSAKTAPELQIHEISRWSSSTVDLKFQRVFGTPPDLPSSL
jgi:hypothetical protein